MQKFRLGTLLKLRAQERDAAAQDVMDAKSAIHKLESAKTDVLAENDRLNEFRKASSMGAVNMQAILDSQRFQMLLQAQVQQLDEHLGKLRQELQRREAKLLLCQQGVKALEKLRDQKVEQWMASENKQQQERTDEWAGVRSANDIRTGSDPSR